MGLIQDAAPPQMQQQAPQQQAPPQMQQQAPPQQQKLNLPPEQQQQLELIANQAADYILQDKNTDILVKMAQRDPVEAIVTIGEAVLNGIYEAASQAGQQLSQELMGIAATQVALLFAAILVNEGVIDIKQLNDVAQKAYEAGITKHNASFDQQPSAQQPMAQQGGGQI